jgi:hypothetical protein
VAGKEGRQMAVTNQSKQQGGMSMGLGESFRHNEPGTTADRTGILARYKHLRAVGRTLNHKLVRRLSKEVLHEGGRKLGFLKRNTLVFGSEDETAILMDYCIYNVRRQGRNAIEQYLLDSPPAPESDEMICLRAMQRAVYSLFVVESVIRGYGVEVRDIHSNRTIVVVDMGFGSTAQPGVVFASRLLLHEGFSMTGGAALPLGVLPEDQQHSMTRKLAEAAAPDDSGYFDPAPLIRACLSRGCSSHIRYQEPSGRLFAQQRVSDGIRSVGRNDPCPCGSGKKFKNCCIKRT